MRSKTYKLRELFDTRQLDLAFEIGTMKLTMRYYDGCMMNGSTSEDGEKN